MGFENRDYYREDEGPTGLQISGDLSITVRIILICGAMFLLDLFLGGEQHLLTHKYLSLQSDAIVKPWFWFQFLSYGFAHDPANIGHIFWTMLGLFFFGSDVERLYGRKEYLRFYLIVTVLGGVAWGLRMLYFRQQGLDFTNTLLGANGAVSAITLLFCMHYPYRNIFLMGVLPVPAWAIGAMIILGNITAVFGSMAGGGMLNADPSIVGVAFTILYYKLSWNLGRLPGMNGLSQFGNTLKQWFKPRPNLKVYAAEEDDSIHSDLEAEADRILEKINQVGESQLTTRERQLLERYSRLMRQKHR